MLFTKSFIFTTRQEPKIADCKSHSLLLRGSFLTMIASGIYSYLPLGVRVLNKITEIIKRNMNNAGAQELLMSALQPIDLWQKTGRDKDLKDIMFRFKDRKDKDLCLGPTHEEEVTEIVKKYIFSYNQLPRTLYQIQVKFRDEPRARFGLMRSCEFIMKDAYSFDIDLAGLDINYQKMLAAYKAIFQECGLNVIIVEADCGVMGGNASHEFMVPAEIGEDILFLCKGCNNYLKENINCPKCGNKVEEVKVVEIGHIFKLGTKYTVAQEVLFLDKDGQRKPPIMGCYGIGVSRLLPAIVETNYDDKGIIWPKGVSPFDISLLVLEDKLLPEAISFAQILEKEGKSVLIDDREQGPGVKFNDAYLIGNPYIVIMGKKYLESGKLDIEIRKTREKINLTKEEFINYYKG